MWSYFSRDSLAHFPYEFVEEITYLNDKTLWKVFNGKKKTSPYDKATLFYCELKGLNVERSDQVKSCFRSFKTLRHPNLLAFVDGTEAADKMCVATEPVTSLSQYAMGHDISVEEVTLGLHQVCTALEFVIQRCNMIHNNVNWSSVFVTRSGEWKLGGFEFLMKKDSEIFPQKLTSLQVYDPPERSRGGVSKRALHAADSWGLGCLLWELYNGPLPRPQAIKSPGKVPQILCEIFRSLTTTNPASRLAPWQLIEQGSLPGGFMNNVLVKSNIFLDEIQIKNTEEKRYFLQSLHEKLDLIPKNYAVYKVLPILLDIVNSNVAFGSIVLPSLMKIGESLGGAEYEAQIVPVVVKLFSSPDRQTRISLLTKIDCYIEHVKNSTVNNDIYPHIIQGFMDTNPSVREQTVKAMLFVAPKLNNKNLNDDLMRHFARIQAKDEHAGIRTNTTVCIGKLAGYMDPATRQKVLPAASSKAMRDPFPPSRIAGILAVLANLKYFTVKDTACRCLPSICPLTCDPEKPVREQAFKAVHMIVKRLEDVHEKPEKVAELESEVNKTLSLTSGNKDILKSFTGWVLSSWSGNSGSNALPAANESAGSGSIGDAQSSSSLKPNSSGKSLNQGLSKPDNGKVLRPGHVVGSGSPAKTETVSEEVSLKGGWSEDEDFEDMFEDKLNSSSAMGTTNNPRNANSFQNVQTESGSSSAKKDWKSSSKVSDGWEEDDADDETWEDIDSKVSRSGLSFSKTDGPNSAFNSSSLINVQQKPSPKTIRDDVKRSPQSSNLNSPASKPKSLQSSITKNSTSSAKLKPTKTEDDFLAQLEKEASLATSTNASLAQAAPYAQSNGDSSTGGAWDQWGSW